MLYTDPKTQEEIEYRVTPTFKKRVKQFVKDTYKLSTLPTNSTLKVMFNVPISKPMSWLKIFAVTEDKAIADEKTPREVFFEEVDTACKKYGCVKGDIAYVGAPTVNIHKQDKKGIVRLIGVVGLFTESVQIAFNKRGNYKAVPNMGNGFHQMIAMFERNP